MIKYKIVEVHPSEHSVVVRFYSDVVTEAMLAVQRDEAGKIVRCRTDYNINLPVPSPTGPDLVKFIMGYAPVAWLKTQEEVLNPAVDTSMTSMEALLGVEVVPSPLPAPTVASFSLGEVTL